MKADLHMHTKYSEDSNISLDKLINRCLKLSINCVAIADHGTTEGALKLKDLAPFTVIIAEEILTPHGEIMGMFLKETIPSHLSVLETISRIKDQDGLVCIPHPFDRFRASALDNSVIEEIIDQIDIVEVFNARAIPFQNLNKAHVFAQKHAIAQSAGSDAHTLAEVGHAYVEMPEFSGRGDFLQALTKGKVCGRRTNPYVHFYSLSNRIKRKLNSW
jgi:hypothetical protein|tara:strand:- start:37 stop:687 length:651 start_codon:yes stop_codon:yes gene_type:complete